MKPLRLCNTLLRRSKIIFVSIIICMHSVSYAARQWHKDGDDWPRRESDFESFLYGCLGFLFIFWTAKISYEKYKITGPLIGCFIFGYLLYIIQNNSGLNFFTLLICCLFIWSIILLFKGLSGVVQRQDLRSDDGVQFTENSLSKKDCKSIVDKETTNQVERNIQKSIKYTPPAQPPDKSTDTAQGAGDKTIDTNVGNIAPAKWFLVIFSLLALILVLREDPDPVKQVEKPEPPIQEYEHYYRVHTVKKSESLSLIAGIYGVDLQELIQMNGIENKDLLKVGQQLKIPKPH